MEVPPITPAYLLSLVVTLLSGGGIVGLLMWITTRKKNEADIALSGVKAESEVANTVLSYAAMLRTELNTLRDDIVVMSDRAKRLEKHIAVLESHIRLQLEFITKLQGALKEYNPNHPLLSHTIPSPPSFV